MNIRNILLTVLTINVLIIGSIAASKQNPIKNIITNIAQSPAMTGVVKGAAMGVVCNIRQPNFTLVLKDMCLSALAGGAIEQACAIMPRDIYIYPHTIVIVWEHDMTRITIPKRIHLG